MFEIILSFTKWNNLTPIEIIQMIDILIFCIMLLYEIFNFIKDRILLIMAGKSIFKNINNRSPFGNYIKLFIATIITLGLHIVVSNIIKDTMFLISKTAVISFLLLYINKIFNTNIDGFYENGIIQNKYIPWDKITSYFYFQHNTVTFFINNKKQIKDITMEIKTENIEILNKYLIKKRIDYRNIYERIID